NKQCFNDGYHIGHHLKPHMHWTDMPGDFVKNIDKYAENKALVFEGVDYNQIWAMLMFKRYHSLADHLVNINGMYRSREDAITLMKVRTRKF
ncbi:MAG: fatty acid desaturase, partial [Saprospiraceae bacterium]|nr:fatty acid desaturase [Saprospiraceae bacterium]